MNDKYLGKYPQEDKRDKLHKWVLGLSAIVPLAPEIISEIIKSPIDERRDKWFDILIVLINQLIDDNLEITPEKLIENEKFKSAIIYTTAEAIKTQQQERLNMFRNVVANSACQNAPAIVMQELFLKWITDGEFTIWHINILKLFRNENLPELHLNSNNWTIDLGLSKLADYIGNAYPSFDIENNYHFLISILDTLHSRKLIANSYPQKGIASRISHTLILTKIGMEFLDFVTINPLERDAD